MDRFAINISDESIIDDLPQHHLHPSFRHHWSLEARRVTSQPPADTGRALHQRIKQTASGTFWHRLAERTAIDKEEKQVLEQDFIKRRSVVNRYLLIIRSK